MVEESDAKISEFDERHREYLVLRELKLLDIVKLAHLVSPAEWSGLKVPPDKSIVVTPHFTAFKNEAIYERIRCEHKGRPGAIIDHAALISLADLVAFLTTVGPEWHWLRSFVNRWQRYCTEPAIEADGASKPKRRTEYDIEEVTRRYRIERSNLEPYPTQKADQEWFEVNFPGLPRSIWREKIRAQFTPDHIRKPGPRAKFVG